MRVELAADLFPHPPSTVQLDALAHLAFEGAHRIFIEDDADPRFLEWLNQLGPGHRDEWNLVLSDAYDTEAREPAQRHIRVTRSGTSAWDAQPPQLNLSDAVGYLRLPFVAMLEDWHSDKGFLLAVATPEQRAILDRMEKANTLQFQNGGGISNMPKQIQAMTETPGANFRMWAMSDSDAMLPGKPSSDALRFVQVCRERSVPHHQLTRRSIENYLPQANLESWSRNSGQHRAVRLRRVRALSRLSRDQRSHFNMKNGFSRDAKRTDASAGELYQGVNPTDLATLDEGFGDDVAGIYLADVVTEANLRDDESWMELNEMISNLVALVR